MMGSTGNGSLADVGILLAARPAGEPSAAELGVPAMLLPLHERSLLQRAVEHLVRSGCRQIHVALGDDAAEAREFLHNGERWGCRMHYHYLDPQESLGRFVRRLELRREQRYWLADALRVPLGALPALDGPGTAAGQPLCWSDGGQPRWTGWGLYTGAFLTACEWVPGDTSLHERMREAGELSPHEVPRPLSAAGLADLLDGSRRLLATQTEEVVIGRNSRIHPEATIIAPVFIGAHVKIGAGAIVGPDVAIGSGTFIDRGAHLRDCVVMPDSYVGEELDLHGTLVKGSKLANIALNVVTDVADANLLAELEPDRQSSAHGLLAGALRLALAPLYWASRWQTRGTPGTEPPVAIPRPRGDRSAPGRILARLALPETRPERRTQRPAEHFCRTFYPGLREVMHGHLQLVGPTPRSVQAIGQLPPEWRDLYGEYHCGLLNEGLLVQAPATPEDQFASDALACASQGDPRATAKLLRRYLGLLLRDLCKAGPAGQTDLVAATPLGAGGENSRITHRPT